MGPAVSIEVGVLVVEVGVLELGALGYPSRLPCRKLDLEQVVRDIDHRNLLDASSFCTARLASRLNL